MEAKNLRSRARESLAGSWGVSIGVAAVAAILSGLLTGSSFFPELSTDFPIHTPALDQWRNALENWLRSFDESARVGDFTFTLHSGVFGLLTFLLGGVIQLGYAQFLLYQHDGRNTEFRDLFSQFHRFGTGFAQRFLRNLYVSLWSLLLIVPGIVKSYSYAMTPFLLTDRPELTASQAINASKELMEGHKMDLFILDLTFIGWDILASITLNLGNLALNPYKNAARAAFYRELVAENRHSICA